MSSKRQRQSDITQTFTRSSGAGTQHSPANNKRPEPEGGHQCWINHVEAKCSVKSVREQVNILVQIM